MEVVDAKIIELKLLVIGIIDLKELTLPLKHMQAMGATKI
jgi:hypothetical protein